jgi:hypothetical protein
MRAKALIIGTMVLLALMLAASTALASVPVNASPPQISGTAAVGSTLTATPGAWTGAQSVTTQWWQCDLTFQDGCTTQNAIMLMDATTSTYTPRRYGG